MAEEEEKSVSEIPKKEHETKEAEGERPGKADSKMFLFAAIGIIVVLAAIFSIKYFHNPRNPGVPLSLDELHVINMEGKLSPEQGYVYNGFSFVKFENMWFTKIRRENDVISLQLHYGPRESENITVVGKLDADKFDSGEVYLTFDPSGEDLGNVGVAWGEISFSLVKVFETTPASACIKNETEACAGLPMLDCSNEELPIIYFKEAETTMVKLQGNCAIIQGRKSEIVRAADKFLWILYGII